MTEHWCHGVTADERETVELIRAGAWVPAVDAEAVRHNGRVMARGAAVAKPRAAATESTGQLTGVR
jgi:hypothetical protein